MGKNYLKPEIIEETGLERKLVYADPATEFQGCSTIAKLTDKDTQLS